LSDWVEGREEEESFISVVTASELLHGVHRASEASLRTRRSAFVEGVLGSLSILPIDLTIARLHAQIGAALADAGRPIGVHDLWLASSCVAYGLRLVTANLREFRRIPGLVVEPWP
jgi:tRNA(fMet)-specific endonuclease VapC